MHEIPKLKSYSISWMLMSLVNGVVNGISTCNVSMKDGILVMKMIPRS
jgi:hypothetical protein